jgi:hypothetical protein
MEVKCAYLWYPSFPHLPDDMLCCIIDFLDYQNILHFGRVCKRFNVLHNREDLWKKLYKQHFEGALLKYDQPADSWKELFKITVGAPTWDPIEKSDDIQISNRGFTAHHVVTLERDSCAKSSKGYSSGRHYFELYVDSKGHRHPYIGIVDGSFDVKASQGYMWDAKNRRNYSYGSTGSIWEAGNKLFDHLDQYDSGDSVGFLVDCERGMVSFYLNKKLQKTVTDIGIIGTTVYPAIGLYGNNHKVTFVVNPNMPSQLPEDEGEPMERDPTTCSS